VTQAAALFTDETPPQALQTLMKNKQIELIVASGDEV